MMRRSVLLPHPDGPISETSSPGRMSSVMSSSACAAALEDLRHVGDRDGCRMVLLAHAMCSGAARTTSFSAITTAQKNTIPSPAATMFVAQSACGSIE